MSYELHYGSFAGVDDRAEWDLTVLALRAALEASFEAQLLADVDPPGCSPKAVGDTLFRLAEADEGPSLSRHLEAMATSSSFASSWSTARPIN